jgi:hypothetical protein
LHQRHITYISGKNPTLQKAGSLDIFELLVVASGFVPEVHPTKSPKCQFRAFPFRWYQTRPIETTCAGFHIPLLLLFGKATVTTQVIYVTKASCGKDAGLGSGIFGQSNSRERAAGQAG